MSWFLFGVNNIFHTLYIRSVSYTHMGWETKHVGRQRDRHLHQRASGGQVDKNNKPVRLDRV